MDFVPSAGLIKSEKILPEFITELTNITEMMLVNADNPDVLEKDMKQIYEYCDIPTFIAHNGNSFDHRLMKQKGLLLTYSSKFLDSKSIIHMLYAKSDLTGAKLVNIYEIIMGHKPRIAHRAKADVMMLVHILRKLNMKLTDFNL